MGWHQNLMSFVPFFPEKLGWHHYTFYSISTKSWGGTCHPGHPSNYGPDKYTQHEFIHQIILAIALRPISSLAFLVQRGTSNYKD